MKLLVQSYLLLKVLAQSNKGKAKNRSEISMFEVNNKFKFKVTRILLMNLFWYLPH